MEPVSASRRGLLATYSQLATLGRAPTTYETLTTRLHFYPDKGFPVATPVAAWFARYQAGSPWRGVDWERFADPRATTYASYTARQCARERELDAALTALGARTDPGLLAWRRRLGDLLGPLLFAGHGLQMIAAYIGQLAPSGRITVAAALQAADEMRRVERLAAELADGRAAFPALAADARRTWQEAPHWQGLRRLVERLLVTYDWGEAFVANNLVVKRALDDELMGALAARARDEGDQRLVLVLAALREDTDWHARWSQALFQLAAEETALLGAAEAWTRHWRPEASAAISAVVQAVGA